ncbi:hypothetical protein [Halogranum gelatinilyticum]|nr:hypothetical protein [Halogranum gelatinilyticum]
MTMTSGVAGLEQATSTPTPTGNQTATDEPLTNQTNTTAATDELVNVTRDYINETRNTTTSPKTSGTSTSTPTPEPSTPDVDRNATTYAAEIGPVTKLVDWDYRDGRFYLLVESKIPNRVTLSESPDVSRGAGSFNIKTVNVPRGRTMLEVNAAKNDGAAVVSITTSQCIAAGSCGYVSTGQKGGPSPFEQTTSTAGWLGGVTVTGLMVTVAAYRRKHKEHDPVEGLE